MEAELDRRAQGLTADAKQKISLGRGMVREDVNALLFDEPLTPLMGAGLALIIVGVLLVELGVHAG